MKVPLTKADAKRLDFWLALCGSVATVLFATLGFVMDLISVQMRLVLMGAGALLAIVGLIGALRQRRNEAESRLRIADLKTKLDDAERLIQRADPGRSLDAIARAVFPSPGVAAWRLSLFVVESIDGVWFLRRLARRSGSEAYESSGRLVIPLEHSLVRGIMDIDLSDQRHPHVGQSGSFPDRSKTPEEWRALQSRVMPVDVVLALTMPTRKYAWCAVRDDERRTLVLLAESVDPDGIIVDSLSSPVLGPSIGMIAHLAELPISAGEQVHAVGAALASERDR